MQQGSTGRPGVVAITSLTAIRGIAALAVVLFHIDVCLRFRTGGALIDASRTGLIAGGYLWVDLFFVLSGFIIFHAYQASLGAGPGFRSASSYLWARFTRIYPLHLFTLAVLVLTVPVIGWAYPGVIDNSWRTYFDPTVIADHVFLLHSMNQHDFLSWNLVSWSIAAEWFAYVSAPFLIPVLVRCGSWASWGAIGVGLAGIVGLVELNPRGDLDITFNYGFARCACEFLIGLGIYKFYARGNLPKVVGSDGAIALCAALILAVLHFDLHDAFIVPLFAFLVLALSVNGGAAKQFLDTKPLQYFGKISYSIYMVHGLVYLFSWFFIPYLITELGVERLGLIQTWTFAALFMSVSVFVAGFTHRYVEVACRATLRNFGKNVTDRLRWAPQNQ